MVRDAAANHRIDQLQALVVEQGKRLDEQVGALRPLPFSMRTNKVPLGYYDRRPEAVFG